MNQTNDTNRRIAEANPEELRVRIALHLGAKWRRFKDCQIVRLSFNDRAEIVEPERPSIVLFSVTIPNYTESLDAMAEAEKAAGFHDVSSKGTELRRKYIRNLNRSDGLSAWGFATAAQRAAAFLAVVEGRGGESEPPQNHRAYASPVLRLRGQSFGG